MILKKNLLSEKAKRNRKRRNKEFIFVGKIEERREKSNREIAGVYWR